MLTLYHNDMSVCSQKVRVCLAEKGLPWEDRHIVLRDGEHQQDWYLKLNRRSCGANSCRRRQGDPGIRMSFSNTWRRPIQRRAFHPTTHSAARRCGFGPNNLMRMFMTAARLSSASALHIAINISRRGEAGRKMLEKIPNLFKRERRRDVIEKGPKTPCISLLRSSAWCSSLTTMEETLGERRSACR